MRYFGHPGTRQRLNRTFPHGLSGGPKILLTALLVAAVVFLGVSCGVAQGTSQGASQGATKPAGDNQAHSRKGSTGLADNAKGAKRPPTQTNKRTNKQTGGSGGAGLAAASVCPPAGQALAGVYHPERLKVLDSCKKASGTVVDVRHEEDGDLHINIAPDPAYKDLLIPGNYSAENGDLVVEFMARDGSHLPKPEVDQHVDLVGTYVNDLQHDWAEIHPVWSVSINGGPVATSGPRYGGSPNEARSYNAEGECRTQSGATCRGYGSGSYSEDASKEGKPAGGGGQSGSPSKTPAAPAAQQSASGNKDYNCSDFTTQAEAQKYLLPGDPYRLDANHDGSACDSLP